MEDTSKTIYKKYPFENAFIRYYPADNSFMKFSGKPEFKTSMKESKVFTEAFLNGEEITKEEYDNLERINIL